MSMKNTDDTIGKRARDFPPCSAVLQPTAPPAACPGIKGSFNEILNGDESKSKAFDVTDKRCFTLTINRVPFRLAFFNRTADEITLFLIGFVFIRKTSHVHRNCILIDSAFQTQ